MRRQGGLDPRWWLADKEEPDAVAAAVVNVVKLVHDADSDRRMALQRNARLYGPGLSLGRASSPEAARFGALSMNVVRALVQTAGASLLEHPPPRPWFLTDGSDYGVQRRAKGMTKLAAGALSRSGFDAQARGDTLLSAALGTAITKVFERDGEPCVERRFPWEVLVDHRDGYDGAPRCMYEISWVDRDVLRARYAKPVQAANDGEEPEEPDEDDPIARAIDDAKTCGLDLDPEHDTDTTTDQVCVLDAWHLESSEGAGDGRHVTCTDTGVLLDEPWEEPDFPFAFLRWSEPLTGFWAPGVADDIWTLQYEINLVIERIRQMLHTVAVPRTWIEEGSKVRPGPLTNEIGGIHYYRGAKPVTETARAVAPELWQYLEYLWSKAFQLLGISELAASAMKPAGVDSGKALRIYADLTSGRMAGWSRAWQDYYLAVSRQIVSLMRRLSKRGGEITFLDKKARRLERVRWADVALKEGEYEIECFPVSSLPSSPAARVQMLDEWLNSGIIDLDQYRRLLDIPDLGAEMDLLNAPRDNVEASIEAMLYGSDEEARSAPRPSSYDNLGLWLRFGPLHLLKARMAGAPGARLALLETAIVEAEALLAEMSGQGAGGAPAAPPAPDAMAAGGAMPPPEMMAPPPMAA